MNAIRAKELLKQGMKLHRSGWQEFGGYIECRMNDEGNPILDEDGEMILYSNLGDLYTRTDILEPEETDDNWWVSFSVEEHREIVEKIEAYRQKLLYLEEY